MNCTFASHAEDTVGGTTITYAAMSFGTASTDRILVVLFGDRNNATGTPTSVTIGGITATAISGASAVVTNEIESYAYYAKVPTGTSGDVVVNYAAATIRSSAALYALTGANSVPNGSAGNTFGPAAGTAVSTTLTVPDRGVSMHICMDRMSSTNSTDIAWTNSTQDYFVSVGAVQGISSAHDSTATANLVVTATSNGTGAGNELVISSVAWGPQPEWNFDQQGSAYVRPSIRASGGTPT